MMNSKINISNIFLMLINQRIGSQTFDNIEKHIDSYLITHENGDDITTIYISPYQAKNSKKVPKGLKLIS